MASSGNVISAVQWRPNGSRPRIVVLQGDLTECPADAIVNAANSQLWHGGGLVGAIARRGGRAITEESDAWIAAHDSLPVGKAMVTSGGKLPCRFVIHTVGPRIAQDTPTADEAQQLRSAVWSVLCEAEALAIQTIAIPGISSGIFGYPRDLAAREILGECVRFCRERVGEAKTTLETIALMNNDTPTCKSFVNAIQEETGDALEMVEDDVFPREKIPSGVGQSRQTVNSSEQTKQRAANERELTHETVSNNPRSEPTKTGSDDVKQLAPSSLQNEGERRRHSRRDSTRCTIM